MADLTIDTTIFRTEVEGDATRPALMLSNSLGTDLSMWDGQMLALTQHFRIIRYDARGHGGSGGGDGPVSIKQLGRDALAILDALDIEKTHWVGVSMGGAVGLWLLANAPERIDRAVLANTAPKLGTPEGWNARITSVLGHGMDETAAATIERWFSADFIGRDPTQVEAIHDLLRKTSAEGYAACCAALRDMDLRESLGRIGQEVLVVSGRHDPVVPAHESKALARGIAGARHVVLDALHLSNVEAAEDFNTEIVAFLTAKPTRTRAKPTGRQRVSDKTAPRKPSSRKAAPAKAAPAKRGSATRRSNAARNPLKKTAAKIAIVKKATPAARTAKKKPAATRRRPVAKAVVTRRAAPKVAAKKRPAKSPRKSVTARRPTPTTTARSPVKRTAVKTSAVKASAVKASAKAAAKKAKPIKKVTRKTAAKVPVKKLPATRRKPVAKARRPTGRRKP